MSDEHSTGGAGSEHTDPTPPRRSRITPERRAGAQDAAWDDPVVPGAEVWDDRLASGAGAWGDGGWGPGDGRAPGETADAGGGRADRDERGTGDHSAGDPDVPWTEQPGTGDAWGVERDDPWGDGGEPRTRRGGGGAGTSGGGPLSGAELMDALTRLGVTSASGLAGGRAAPTVDLTSRDGRVPVRESEERLGGRPDHGAAPARRARDRPLSAEKLFRAEREADRGTAPRAERGRPRGGPRAPATEPPEHGSAATDAEPDRESVARGIVLRLLTGSAKSRAQLSEALARKDVPEEVAERVLDRFTEVGLVDDAAYAQSLVRTGHAERGLSRRAVAQELRRRGVGDADAAEALAQIDDDDEEEAARAFARRKLSATRGLDRDVRLRRTYAALGRKGYGAELVSRVVRAELAAEEPEDTGGTW